ncbi:MAG: hypothetical protein HY660_11065 [Armatimonadetes bacterium]|nr:hypothetical protein [Armatimonadota bacterium]
MPERTHPQTIHALNEALRAEHTAILQYLQHTYALGGTFADELEEIAREEMWHLKALGEAVADLGGEPAVWARGDIQVDAPSPATLLRLDLAAEERMIVRCRRGTASAEDHAARRLFERLLQDEEAHRHEVEEMTEALERRPRLTLVIPRTSTRTIQLLAEDVQAEYRVLLKYLYQSFKLRHSHSEISRTLELQAIESMKHLGWFSEAIVALGGRILPRPESPVPMEGSLLALLKGDLGDEQAALAQYRRHLGEVSEPEARAPLLRISGQEVFHEEEFVELIARVARQEGTGKE